MVALTLLAATGAYDGLMSPMRFVIEQRHLTDMAGKPVTPSAQVSFYTCEAGDADEAVRLFVRDHQAEIIGNIVKFPGFQAVATMRNPSGVFTLQIAPSSQQLKI